ncbi:MAG: hypothetical protein E7005_06725 [Alphaproteobacteria bacterium]|nr:hypothetical protein [Alphaproteobacteria bacterium]
MSERRHSYDRALAHPPFKIESRRLCNGLIECLCWKFKSDRCGLQAKTFWEIVLAKAIAVVSL